MGFLVDGVWQDKWYDTRKSGGKYIRDEARNRNWVTADGQSGPSGEGGFAAESGVWPAMLWRYRWTSPRRSRL